MDLENIAVTDLITIDIVTDEFVCRVCGKKYKARGFLQNHIRADHRDAVKNVQDKLEIEMEEKAKEWEKERALKSTDEYFEYLLSSIDDLKRTVKRHKEGFEAARDRKSYSATGKPIDLSNMAHEIEWCIHHVTRNFVDHSDKGVRACMNLTKAFDLEI